MKDFDTYIRDSKINCEMVYNLKPDEVPFLKFGLTKKELQYRKHRFAKELSVVHHFMKKLIQNMEGIPTLIITTDNQGYILDIYGDQSIKEMVDSLGIKLGTRFKEKDVGTNSVSLALKHQKPIALIGKDHFHDCLSETACYSAPFCFSSNGSLVGTVSMMTTVNYASNFHLGLLSSAVDTIEREIQLQEQNHTLHLLNQVLTDSTPLGIVMTDKKGKPLEFNSSAEEIICMQREKIIDNGIAHIGKIGEYINYVLETGKKVENAEFSFSLIENDQSKNLLLDVLPLFDEDHLIGAFAQFRDMTNYHELQQKLIESEKLSAIGKLGAGLAHEIRNPLTSIIGLTHLMKENNHKKEYLDIIIAELERMENLVNQFVSYGKPSSIERVHCNLNDLIADTVELMNSNASLHNVDIYIEPTNINAKIYIDESKIKQILINFIKNAFEAMPKGGDVCIQLESDYKKEEVHISIKDEGLGMTKEQVNNLGTPFFTTKENGLGMGLPICFDIIQAHEGKINFHSEKGKGTEVHIILPLN
ncbi:Signal transduction histidine kinase [Gracilibacillus orientalis]|uniref:histidine kinase n=1 Tax=Gracilibacillus orientalis TaxID=334253 RepID=A0A1I4L5Y0_9BACI|nr:ATP-binding protein [Gracilibacillus orientalis]SFL86404.1 Signal transduction histidine kinase [Gracilibacillus orientalis]